ncbi:hypothetical protein TeGR_g8824 [Tetraparma gracilis]|uniref:DUF2256 domain-containing protein n=1 Tax=Tetraparma gracilis TaxID=2962635 RepID=A0ABQ6M4R2_9STRA|nr:hypothetical protein TeGR_g8824 [Tetraparma gracilis]
MPRGVEKANLPTKVCAVCERPFTWRKKWERCWDEVTTCSKSCNAQRRREKQGGTAGIAAKGGEVSSQERKAARRAKRDGTADPALFQKPCDLCTEPQDVLIRCAIDSTGAFRMVCGRCWKGVSGGVTDGDAMHPHYRYGGLWRNRYSQAPADPDLPAAAA